MKLYWSPNKTSVILLAETRAEVAFCELFVDGMQAHQFAKKVKGNVVVGAKWTLTPDDPPEAGKGKE